MCSTLYLCRSNVMSLLQLRLPAEDDRFLINPFGLLFHEVTASSLITLDHAGNVIDPGSSCFTPNPRGFVLHSAIHQARRDINCVLHMHMPQAIAISCLKDGYQAVCQEGISIGPVSTLGFDGVISEDERQSVVTALGNNHVSLSDFEGTALLLHPIPLDHLVGTLAKKPRFSHYWCHRCGCFFQSIRLPL